MSAEIQAIIEYLEPRPGQWLDLEEGLKAVLRPDHIFVAAAEPWFAVCSGVTGGGLGRRRYFLNRQVKLSYNEVRPEEEMASFLEANFQEYSGADSGDWAGLMTGAKVIDAGWTRLTLRDSRVTVIVTAGVNNACTAGITPCCPLESAGRPLGTINIMAFYAHALSAGAVINAVQTATEAKAQTLREMQIFCPVTGAQATGTNTDALIIAAPDRPPLYPYAGPGALPGYLLALGVRHALKRALERYLQWKKNSAAG
ncbi:MAG TPA: adenosylcobinamide amidohydrolase [Bacillota bacterium]|mgnify:CR=1 FL=1|jgi:iron complex transport system ATP-binding protein|nr:adenosylcobinamide amidohydrolase [Peptococcaceae bacterium MAG4]NLW37218.1 adenosylcobinamide amidohydrolase [Peptococcaceae bacterium]HPZ42933.1 adenosylcobinamide amidohydrolase [Bacillota bacterium]HQD75512.1 adenosylcobinamide amidohydrolase [Bacillota bacterium]HUM58347.1 adenosylcobinamide amidohydrolase [Bacillota bacterium]